MSVKRKGVGRVLRPCLCLTLGMLSAWSVFAAVTVWPVSCMERLSQLGRVLLCLQMGGLLAFGVLLAVWYDVFANKNRRLCAPAMAVACLLSFLWISGQSLRISQTQVFFFLADGGLPCRAVLFAAFATLAYTLISELYAALERIKRKPSGHPGTGRPMGLYDAAAIAAMLVGWIPFLIAGYPGAVPTDTLRQLKEAAGVIRADASNPLLVTWMYGTVFETVRRLWNDNGGIFLNVLMQTLLCIAAMSRACVQVYRRSGSGKAYAASVAFFAVVPVWGTAVQCVLKDVVHTAFFLLFLAAFMDTLYSREMRIGRFMELGLFAVLAGLSRKAAVALVLLSMLALTAFFLRSTYRRRMLATTALVSACFLFANLLIALSPHVNAPMERENYSLPFQQMARYCKEYGHEMSEEEIRIVDSVLDFETIREKYTSYISDPVKATFHADGGQMKEFFKLYVKCGLRHPDVYVKHLLAGTYGYTFPAASEAVYRRTIEEDEAFYDAAIVNESLLDVMVSYYSRWKNGSMLSLLMGSGLYIWVLILLVGYAAASGRRTALLSVLPVVILGLGLMFTHVNGELRYAYPLIASIPLCSASILYAPAGYEASRRGEEHASARDGSAADTDAY